MTKPNAALIDSRTLRWVPLLLAVCLNGCAYYTQLAVGQVELLPGPMLAPSTSKR